jgi:hypothetical protein
VFGHDETSFLIPEPLEGSLKVRVNAILNESLLFPIEHLYLLLNLLIPFKLLNLLIPFKIAVFAALFAQGSIAVFLSSAGEV